MDAYDVIDQAVMHMEEARAALFEAADMLSDLQAEYHGDRGMGVPAKNARIERLYALSALLEEKTEFLLDNYTEG